MEKLDRPATESWFGDGEIVDADLLVDLLEAYRFGKDNVPIGKIRFKEAATAPLPDNTTKMEDEEDDDGSQGTYSQLVIFHFLWFFIYFSITVPLNLINSNCVYYF